MGLAMEMTVAPARWEATKACDVRLEMVLRNDGSAPLTVYPALAKLDAIASFAGIGIAWRLGFWRAGADAKAAVPVTGWAK